MTAAAEQCEAALKSISGDICHLVVQMCADVFHICAQHVIQTNPPLLVSVMMDTECKLPQCRGP